MLPRTKKRNSSRLSSAKMKVARSRPVLFEELNHGQNISTKGLPSFVGCQGVLITRIRLHGLLLQLRWLSPLG